MKKRENKRNALHFFFLRANQHRIEINQTFWGILPRNCLPSWLLVVAVLVVLYDVAMHDGLLLPFSFFLSFFLSADAVAYADTDTNTVAYADTDTGTDACGCMGAFSLLLLEFICQWQLRLLLSRPLVLLLIMLLLLLLLVVSLLSLSSLCFPRQLSMLGTPSQRE
jgi:hypothetical protein